MAKIKVHDLKPTGSELFDDSESFMSELSSDELGQSIGGTGVLYDYNISPFLWYQQFIPPFHLPDLLTPRTL